MTRQPQAPLNPYPGLRPFEPHETYLFFGRDGQSNELLRRLRQNRFLVVVGASGSGKSSLVRAGLLPDLQGGLMAGGGSHWRIAIMRPGGDPIGNLARALNQPDLRPAEPEDGDDSAMQLAFTRITLERTALGIAETVRQSGIPAGENVLLVVDQFEELFRFKESAGTDQVNDQANAFVKLLLNAVEQREHPIYLILTMRSDFLGDCAQFPDLPEAINDCQYLIPRMTRDERRQAIVGAAAVAQARFAPRLVQRLLNDVGDDPDQLPILQHALMRTFDHWVEDGDRAKAIDISHYEAIGGMASALSRHADEAYEELGQGASAEQARHRRELAERLFRSLTEKGSDNREIRRPARLGDIAEAAGATNLDEMIAVIDVFRRPGRSFLMPPAGEDLNADSLIDISHESLIRNWRRLALWVTEESRSAADYRRLADTAERWKREEAGLIKNPELQLALTWRDQAHPTAAWAKRYHPAFDLVMNLLDESERKEAADRAAAVRRRRLTVFSLAAFVGVLAVALMLSIWQQSRIRQQEEIASEQGEIASFNLGRVFEAKAGFELTNAAENRRDAGPEHERAYQKAWLYTLRGLTQEVGEGRRLGISLGRLLLPELHPESLLSASSVPSTSVSGIIHSVAFGPEGQAVAYATSDGIGLWYPERAAETIHLEGAPGVDVWDVAFSPDGALLASVSSDGAARIWSTADRQLSRVLQGPAGDAWSVAFHPGGRWLATATFDGGIRLWDLQGSDEPAATLTGHSGNVRSVTFSPDGALLASASSDGTVRLWNITDDGDSSTAAGPPLEGHTGEVWDVAFSSDGNWLASSSGDKTIRIWDMNRLADSEPRILSAHTGDIWSVDFSPDGQLLASASDDQRILLWDPHVDGPPLASVAGHREDILSVRFSPDGRRLVSGSADSVLRLTDFVLTRSDTAESWDLRELIRLPSEPHHAAAIAKLYEESLEALRYRLDETRLTLIPLEDPTEFATSEVVSGIEIPSIPFDSESWTFRSAANPGYPRAAGAELELIPDGRTDAAQIALYRLDVEPPFDIEFEFAIEHAGLDRMDFSGAAEGLVLFFLMNNSVYDERPLPTGSSRGYSAAGGGYSLHFEVHGERMIEFRDPTGHELADYRFDRRKSVPDVYTGGAWRKVRVMVKSNGIEVHYDGLELIRWEGEWETLGQFGLGFGAASGSTATARHAIRNVRLATEYKLALLKEREAFQYLIDGQFAAAEAAFRETEALYNSFHQVYELGRLLRQNRDKLQTPEDRRRIYRTVVDEMSWKAPPDLLDELRKLADEPDGS